MFIIPNIWKNSTGSSYLLLCFLSKYVYSLKATKKGDVYRMELVSGKMPTNASFSLDIDMVKLVETHIEMQGLAWEELIDPALSLLLAREENAAFQVLEIALQLPHK